MNLKIVQHRQFKDEQGNAINNYKVFYKGHGFWLSSKDYYKNNDLLLIQNSSSDAKNNKILVLKEPIEDYYQARKEKNRNGEFYVLVPKKTSEIKDIIAAEPEVVYETKYADNIEIKDLGKIHNIGELKKNGSIKPKTKNKNQTVQNISDGKSEKMIFINNLLDYSIKKKADVNTRNRLFSIISKEVEKSGLSKEDVEKIVEEKLTGRQIEKENKTFKTQHAPIEMVRFLHKFSIDDDLKWFTHNPDNPQQKFLYEEYMAKAKKLIRKNPNFNINFLTFSNVRNFIFDNRDSMGNKYKCWANNDEIIKYTWADVKEWCLQNQNIHPFIAEIEGTPFSKYINQFKNVIEFRNDNGDFTFLTRVQDFVINKLGADFNIFDSFNESFEKIGKTLNVYVDTNLFFKGLVQILSWITQNKAKSNIIEFSLFDESDYYQFEIFHKGSYISYSPDSTKINGQQGDFDKARKNLFCIVEWEIQGSFKYNDKTECCLLTCLDKDVYKEGKGSNEILLPNTVKQLPSDIGGVKHILKLFKTK
jgi:Histidine Kinase domain observed in conflict contexts